MTTRFERSLGALADESEVAEAALRRLADEAFSMPTRCTAWDVRGLAGHLLRDVDRIAEYLATPAPAEADTGAAAYFARFDPVADAPEVAARSIERAAEFTSTTALVESFADTWRSAVTLAREAGPDRIVQVRWGPTLRLDDYLDTRVLEMAVHGLDLADALGEAPWLTPNGGAIVREMLTTLMGTPPPEGWGDAELAEKGTGRRTLSAGDLATLGQAATRFPLLA